MSDETNFVALGPTLAGFSTLGANITYGVQVEGTNSGVVGQSTDDTGQNPPVSRTGVFGRGLNVGVYGMTSAKGPDSGFSTQTAGVFGTSDSSPGVVGTSQSSFGIWGQLGGPGPQTSGAGVFGTAANDIGVSGTSGSTYGVFGVSKNYGPPSPFFNGTNIAGVFGTSGDYIGVLGTSSGYKGVYGWSDHDVGVHGGSRNAFGVVGQCGAIAKLMPPSAAAMLATSSQQTAIAAVSDSSAAIFAQSGRQTTRLAPQSVDPSLFPTTIAATAHDDRFGVFGVSLGWIGSSGWSAAAHGVQGLSFAPTPAQGTLPQYVSAGVYGQSMNGGFGVLGVVNSTPTSPGAAIAGVHPNWNDPDPTKPRVAGVFFGDVSATGVITGKVKNAIVPFPDGSQRLLHCMESPEHWFEDFGSARLKRGRATVKLDADFAKVVTLEGYRVFLTPEGDCHGLYVQSKRGASFEVRELQGGTSSVAFSYRIVAKRKDIKRHTRFAKFETPITVAKGRAPRGGNAAQLRSSTRAMFAFLEGLGKRP